MNYSQDSYLSRTGFIVENIQKKGTQLKILDIGCVGEGNTIHPHIVEKTTANFSSYMGMDIDPDITKMKSPHNVIYKQMSIYDLDKVEEMKERFDVIILAEVLEHLQDTFRALTSLRSALAKDGILIITYPNPFSLKPFIKFALTEDPLSDKQVQSFCGCPEHIYIPALPVFHKYLKSVGLIIHEVGYLKPHLRFFKIFRKFSPNLGLIVKKQSM